MRIAPHILPAVLAAWITCAAVSVSAMEPMGNGEPSFALKTIASQTEWLNTERGIREEDLAGRIILLDFWTYCCINCMHVVPDLHYLEKVFGDKLTIIGVHSAKFTNEQDSENIRQAMLRYGIEHPVVNDADFTIWNAFGINAWPTFMLIAPDGSVVQVYSGEGHRKRLEQDIRLMVERAGDRLRTDPLPLALEKEKAPRSVLNFPGKLDMAADVSGAPMLFVSDSGHDRILGIRLDGTVEMEIGGGGAGLDDGEFDKARFRRPQGVLWDEEAQVLFVADTGNHALRAVDMRSRQVTTLMGDGKQGQPLGGGTRLAADTSPASPWDIAFYPDSSRILIAMAGTHQLWSYDRGRKTVSVVAGNGRETLADGTYPVNSLSQPSGLAVTGDTAWFVDAETSSLRRLIDDRITTLIGTGLFDFGYSEGGREEGRMQHPLGVYANGAGVYVADSYNHAIRLYDREGNLLRNFAGTGVRGAVDGSLAQASFNEPNDIDEWQGKLYVADTNNHRIRVIDVEEGMVSTVPVMPPAVEEYVYDPALPGLERLPAQEVMTEGAAIRLGLSEGWKLNGEAPSYLALFTSEGHTPIVGFDRAALEDGARLPALEPGMTYLLQGVLYYCEDKQGSVCLIRSVELPVTPAADGVVALTIPVR